MSNEKRNMVPISVMLILKKENEILLMRRFNTGYEDGKYAFPGGHVEKGEEVQSAMIREAKEEIGITIYYENLILKHILNRKVKDNAYVDFVFECTKWDGTPKLMELDKSDKLSWFKIDELPTNIIPFMEEIFKSENKIYIPYGW